MSPCPIIGTPFTIIGVGGCIACIGGCVGGSALGDGFCLYDCGVCGWYAFSAGVLRGFIFPRCCSSDNWCVQSITSRGHFVRLRFALVLVVLLLRQHTRFLLPGVVAMRTRHHVVHFGLLSRGVG